MGKPYTIYELQAYSIGSLALFRAEAALHTDLKRSLAIQPDKLAIWSVQREIMR